MNGAKALHLIKDLSPYFLHARTIQAYASKLAANALDRDIWCSASLTDSSDTSKASYASGMARRKCVTEELSLEFDNMLVSGHSHANHCQCLNAS